MADQNTTDPAVLADVAKMTADRVHAGILSRAAKLRKMADEVEQHAGRLAGVPDNPRRSYAGTVAEVQHTVLWGMANLGLDQMVGDAREADQWAGWRDLAAKEADRG